MSRSLTVFAVDQYGHANKENASGKMDKSINLNPVGNIESFGSSINSNCQLTLSKFLLNCSYLLKVFHKFL